MSVEGVAFRSNAPILNNPTCGRCGHRESWHRVVKDESPGRPPGRAHCRASGTNEGDPYCPCDRFLSRSTAKHIRWMNLALGVAGMSKCHRAQYGTIILNKNGHQIGSGYNGKPAGSINDAVCYREGLPPGSKATRNCCLHSEVNAIMFTNRDEREGGTMYVSGLPCEDCSLAIMQCGVTTLVVLIDDVRGYPGLEVIKEYQGQFPNIDEGKLKVVSLTRSMLDLGPVRNGHSA